MAKDFFRQVEGLVIPVPALDRPTLGQIRSRWGHVKQVWNTSPVEEVTLVLGTFLGPEEKWISGGEYARRRNSFFGDFLGVQHALWIEEHQDEFPDLKGLLGEVYIDFPGTVLADADGVRAFPRFSGRGGRWALRWVWAVCDFGSDGRVARKQFGPLRSWVSS